MATSGKYLAVTVSNVTMHKGVQRWQSSEEGEELDDTDAETNGYTSTDVGVKGILITVEGVWDTADGVFPSVRKGQELTDLKAWANSTQAVPDYHLPVARVMKRPRTVEVRGQIRYSMEIRNLGPFYIDGVLA